ncbi:MAG: SUMF1/EgtB/PvdO family nonheme iron enzyme, partial [Kofleriaceae bacterium]|nr:SUMF1/EgtB/PvdO family nonheme iron enzyme [Kofleriaceae bacterium]
AYRRCVIVGGCSSEPLVAGADLYIQDDLPIVNILPDEAAAYCHWRGARLPTEAEWEYAARGADGRVFPWGTQARSNRSNLGQAMSPMQRLLEESRDLWSFGALFLADDRDGFAFAAPPGSLPLGRGPFGTEDQVGNVAEIVADALVPLNPDKPQAELPWVNPWQVALPGELHVVRGGSWATPAWVGRSDVRDFTSNSMGPTRPLRSPTIGFRCARPVQPSLSGAPR